MFRIQSPHHRSASAIMPFADDVHTHHVLRMFFEPCGAMLGSHLLDRNHGHSHGLLPGRTVHWGAGAKAKEGKFGTRQTAPFIRKIDYGLT